jgi:hypothetical protein
MLGIVLSLTLVTIVSLVFRLFGAMGIAVSHSPEEIVSVAIAVAVLSVIF